MTTTETRTNGASVSKGAKKKAKGQPKALDTPAAAGTGGAVAPVAASGGAPVAVDSGTQDDLPTQADIDLAGNCLPSNRKTVIRTVSSKLVDTYATPAFQQKLTGLAPLLATFNGCSDIPGSLDSATQGKALVGSFVRLQNAANRVGQQIIQTNQQLQALDTALGRAQSTAAPTTPVAKGLASLAKLRGAAVAQKKGKRTKNKNKKKKTPKS